MAKSQLKHIRDATANDSDKVVLTAAADKIIEIVCVHAVLASTATAGNRQVLLRIQDETDTLVVDMHAGAVQAASLSRHYIFAQGVYRETSFIDGSIHVPIPPGLALLPGFDLRIYDSAAVDAAADDLTVDVIYRELDHTEADKLGV